MHQWEQPWGAGGDNVRGADGRRTTEPRLTCHLVQRSTSGGHTGMSACVCERDGTDADKLPVSLALSVTASQLCFLFPK